MSLSLALLLAQSPAWAQGGSSASGNNGVGAPSSTGQDGYRIDGEANPTALDSIYLYTREMPDGIDGVYWYVQGAATIDGQPAGNFPDGSLNAQEHSELKIQWDAKAAQQAADNHDTTRVFVLQLRRANPENKDGVGVDVLTDLAIGNPFSNTGHI